MEGSAQAYMRWDISDEFSNIKKTTLQRRTGQQPWRSVKGSTRSAKVSLRPNQRNRFRVQSRDSLGNKATSPVVVTRLLMRDSDSSLWQLPASGWRRGGAKDAQGGSLLLARGVTASLSTSFAGKSMALVAPVGPDRGTLRVRVDGGDWMDIDLKRSRTQPRRVVLTRHVGAGNHLLEVQGLSGRTAVDALVFVR